MTPRQPATTSVIASRPTYEDARAVVRRLGERSFPIERTAIVGRDVEIVEDVTGRIGATRSSLAGGAAGAVLGAVLAGAAIAGGGPWSTLVWAVPVGALVGVLAGLVSRLAGWPRPVRTSGVTTAATTYDVVVEACFASEAASLLDGDAEPAGRRPHHAGPAVPPSARRHRLPTRGPRSARAHAAGD